MNIKYSSHDFPRELDPELIHSFLLELSQSARQITLKYFRNSMDVSNKEKEGFDPVTAADREAEQLLRDLITERFPQHGIIGEEWAPKPTEGPFNWIIDPIDGTRAFISGVPAWGTLVALSYQGLPVAGLMSQPYIGEDFIGLNGKAHLYRNGEMKKINTSAVSQLSKATMFTTSPRIFLSAPTLAAYDQLEEQVLLARYGLDCYGYAMVAAGFGELVVEEGLKDVDIAAMVPIIDGAGGVITTWSGKPVTNGGQVIAAANAQLHAEALEILAPAATD